MNRWQYQPSTVASVPFGLRLLSLSAVAWFSMMWATYPSPIVRSSAIGQCYLASILDISLVPEFPPIDMLLEYRLIRR
ncbi:hypothetical protein F5X99DRAFT_396618 [Biscogniauxia marginata]|nr:hypothetical protein F5X99DRAFT_396618 [Biscogniauxia marginata]